MTERIAGRYELVEVVGRGGEGTLMRAVDHASGATVALKLRPLPDRADARERLEHEAHVLRNLRPHPCLPVIRDAFIDGTHAVLVMEWIEGTNLEVLVRREGTPGLPVADAINVVDQAAGALDHLHDHDLPVVHGDVKPANLIVTPTGHVMLVDFGGALRMGTGTSTTGTRGFRAPEIAAGETPVIASDVFSVAATFFALLAGRAPRFGVRSRWDALDGGTAARVDEALRAGLALDPARRPASAGAFVSTLRSLPRGRSEPGPTNLPSDPSRFVGARSKVRGLAGRLSDTRLLTLVGPGGVGKTRLALEVGRRVARDAPDGVWLVEMGTAVPDRIAERIMDVLNLREAAGVEARDLVAEALRERSPVLILDGCENVREPVAELVRALLGASPGLRVLATSRLPLGAPGERRVTVEPLGLEHGEALELFWERARLANPRVRRRGSDARAAVAICRALEGMPLAIELAAAGMGGRGPADVLERITSAQGPARDAIRRSIAWACETLTATDEALFRRLWIFAGGSSAEDAIEVCAGAPLDASDVVPGLWRLVDRSLLIAEDAGGAVRYRMLDAVREEAGRMLDEAGEQDRMREARLRWALRVCDAAAAGMSSPGQLEWLARLAFELDNLRVAMVVGIEDEPDAVRTLAASLTRFWYLHGHWREGRWWIERVTTDAPASEEVARALTGGGRLAEALGDYTEAAAMFERAVAILRSREESVDLAAALNGLAYTRLSSGDLDGAEALYDEARAIAERVGSDEAVAGALLGRGTVAANAERWEDAIAWCERALPLVRAIGEPAGLGLALTTLAGSEIPAERYDDAERHLSEALELRRRTGDRMGEAVTLNALGELARRARGDRVRAREMFERSLAIRRDIGHAAGIATMLNNLATVLDDPVEQRDAFARSVEIRRRLGNDALTAMALRNLAVPTRTMGDHGQAVTFLLESLDLEERHERAQGTNETLVGLSRVADAAGNEALREGFASLARNVRDGLGVRDAAARARALVQDPSVALRDKGSPNQNQA